MDEEFLRLYKISTMGYAMSDGFWERFAVGQKQVLYDKTYLYGIIVSTNTNSYNKAITKHKQSQDGILTWIEFQTLYAHDGSKELKVEQLTDKLQSPYNPSSKQTMSQYIDMFQDTMERHDTLSTDPYSDIRRNFYCLGTYGLCPALYT